MMILIRIAGNKDKFIGKLQERYGIARDEAEKQSDEWVKTGKFEDTRSTSNSQRQEHHRLLGFSPRRVAEQDNQALGRKCPVHAGFSIPIEKGGERPIRARATKNK